MLEVWNNALSLGGEEENAWKLNKHKQKVEHEALRFPRGEGVMPPAVWGLRRMLFFALSPDSPDHWNCPDNPMFPQLTPSPTTNPDDLTVFNTPI